MKIIWFDKDILCCEITKGSQTKTFIANRTGMKGRTKEELMQEFMDSMV